jgi:hypothetical protein
MRQNIKHSANNRSNGRPKNGHYRPNHAHDSNATDKRFRGTAHQMHEKYLSMARDALSAGNRIDAETYYQHADHFYRVARGTFDDSPSRVPSAPVASFEPPVPIAVPNIQIAEVITDSGADTPSNYIED